MKKILIVILILLSAVSCEKELSAPKTGKEGQLIMNAQLCAADSVHTVWFSIGNLETVGKADSVTFTLYVNGEKASYDYRPGKNTENARPYTFKARFTAGDRLRLVAQSGDETVESDVTVPQKAIITSVDTTYAYMTKGTEVYRYLQFNVTLQDPKDEDNYYQVKIYHKGTSEYVGWPYYLTKDDVPPESHIFDEMEMINSREPLLNSGMSYVTRKIADGSDSYFDNKYNIFNDKIISGSKYTLRLLTEEGYSITSPSGVYGTDYVIKSTSSAVVRILTMSREEFTYLDALEFQNSDLDGTYFVDQPSFPDNVDGGMGFVSVMMYSDFELKFPDLILDESNHWGLFL